jgi:thymidylate synthase ThyX
MIRAEILLDSVNTSGNRIITWVLKYPRFIHSEFMTHRVFSRNAASSRAIPVDKIISSITIEPAMPHVWGLNQKGMQATVEASEAQREEGEQVWLAALDYAVQHARKLQELGFHKQIVNRILEPFAHMTVIVTGTEWDNFFALRAHPAAQPEFQILANKMLAAYKQNRPTPIDKDGWHIPFGDRMPEGITTEQRLKIATARCARVSYLTFEGEIKPEKDYELHDALLKDGHMSPFEHCATALDSGKQSGNFRGWLQYRKQLPNESKIDPRLH